MTVLRVLFALCLLVPAARAAKNLEIYFIDVEGGQATLIVSPSGESLLVDTGWPGYSGRDPERILAAAKKAKLKRIDYVLITHYHTDHVGGVAGLVDRIPVGTFLDHGPSFEPSDKQMKNVMAAYDTAVSKAKHQVVKPGDTIPMKGVEIQVVAAAGEHIGTAVQGAGQPNPLCAGVARQAEDPGENASSVGFVLKYGQFRFVDLADLTWNRVLDLVCPNNLLGTVDVYLSTHHGLDVSAPAALVQALHPRVIVMNNGARKGGEPAAWKVFRDSPGLEDLWQLHFANPGGKETNSPDTFLANIDNPCEGKAIELEVLADGSFTVTNQRNKFSRTYKK